MKTLHKWTREVVHNGVKHIVKMTIVYEPDSHKDSRFRIYFPDPCFKRLLRNEGNTGSTAEDVADRYIMQMREYWDLTGNVKESVGVPAS